MPYLHGGGIPNSWALLGLEARGQRTVIRCYPENVSISRGMVDVPSMGSMHVATVPGYAELSASLVGGSQVYAATYAECLALLAKSWSPDVVTPDSKPGTWRPVPR